MAAMRFSILDKNAQIQALHRGADAIERMAQRWSRRMKIEEGFEEAERKKKLTELFSKAIASDTAREDFVSPSQGRALEEMWKRGKDLAGELTK